MPARLPSLLVRSLTPLATGADAPTERRSPLGINMVDLMMWLVVASLLLAVALQGIGYYRSAAFVNAIKSDLTGAAGRVNATAAINGTPVDTDAIRQGAFQSNWSTGVEYTVEQPTDGSPTYLRASSADVSTVDGVFLFSPCGDLGPGVHLVSKTGVAVCGIAPAAGWGTTGPLGPASYAWTQRTAPGMHPWRSISSSADGTKIVAGMDNGPSTAPTGHLWTSGDGGATWTEGTVGGRWEAVAASSTGSTVIAGSRNGLVYISKDSGMTWAPTAGLATGDWRSVTVSADGTHMAAGDYAYGYVWTSSDSGASWTRRDSGGARQWLGLHSSADGSSLVAGVFNGSIWTSTDYGATWTERTGPGYGQWRGVGSSGDGSKIAVASYSGGYGGYVWTSGDGGATWTKHDSLGANGWEAVSVSSDGNTMLVGGSGGQAFASNDAGATWQAQTGAGSGYWQAVALSSDGTKAAIAKHNEYVYTGQAPW